MSTINTSANMDLAPFLVQVFDDLGFIVSQFIMQATDAWEANTRGLEFISREFEFHVTELESAV